MKITTKTYTNLLHRMSGFDENVTEKYLKKFSNEEIGKLTLADIYNEMTFVDLYNIERRMKLEKLINISK